MLFEVKKIETLLYIMIVPALAADVNLWFTKFFGKPMNKLSHEIRFDPQCQSYNEKHSYEVS
jgi:hypothetical protein